LSTIQFPIELVNYIFRAIVLKKESGLYRYVGSARLLTKQEVFWAMRDLFNLETSVEWGLKCIDFYFWQGTMRRNNALLQRIVTQQKLKSGVL
jgi:hypothetical protein